MINEYLDPQWKNNISELNQLSVFCSKKIEHDLIRFELNRLKKRITLANTLKTKAITSADHLLKNEKTRLLFYKHILYEWTSKESFPFTNFIDYQRKEITKIRSQLQALKEESEDAITIEKELITHIKNIDKKIYTKIENLFPKRNISPVIYKKNPFPTMAHVPGFYKDHIFYFTFEPGKTMKSDMEWLYLHEAIPGHHYQLSLDKKSIALKLFSRKNIYFDFTEGWAAYIETLGSRLGIYEDTNSLIKALKWDLVRSIRVLVDIGIHRNKWTNKKALTFWKKNAPEVYPIAKREIDRIRNWPAQVISYEYGKYKILNSKKNHLANGISEIDFHDFILNQGQVPTSML